MELWIRSQDKLLLTKIDYIIINGLDIFNQNQIIGTYKTYERALEVLDEIQDLFIKKDIVKSELTSEGLTLITAPITYIVYEMPKE